MVGAIIGDISGSVYEFNNIKSKNFPLMSDKCFFTDDTVMSVAVAKAILRSRDEKSEYKPILVDEMIKYGRMYPNSGYGGRFAKWLNSSHPTPYNSFGNGSAMRVSSCGMFAVDIQEALSLAKATAEVTHNHPEGIKGAQAVAGAIFYALRKDKKFICDFITSNFYDLNKTLDEIRPTYSFKETCQETVPQAIQAFLESTDFEDAIRNAVSLGGDSDTLAAITGSIAWPYYLQDYFNSCPNEMGRWPEKEMKLYYRAMSFLPNEFADMVTIFHKEAIRRIGTYNRIGSCRGVPHTDDKSKFRDFILNPRSLSIDHDIPLEEKFKYGSDDIVDSICYGESFVKILCDQKIGVSNYSKYSKLINEISVNTEYLYNATLEECLVYLTYLWRYDYWDGAYTGYLYKHRDEIRNARMRIVYLLSRN